ncbi:MULTISPECIES: Bug family tripartite tricarboxylate transporter substrate binding protein [Ramlibacter]|uniref:Tripartite tricarboxylate transporter substrate binding protein n=1 Tax=Ramlibacter pinisoli TaxID=2682844 RepID=A0A6N8IZW9_9BURK|nr:MULTISPECIES: tripartite tricarboxylate transporter substrate binding protein [Ramlibacter]MBA2962386.1 tripartite tricarboxylate transporter substrate binding protein [Ramlibacter sp. CGMCC 1.13660]MVQ32328.1 tripartite tricarboxylate transporter substrate binding protein [Ramlibacter pinisoli]
MQRREWLALAAAGALAPGLARAAYPERPIRLVIPFAAGGNGDIMARVTAPYLVPGAPQGVVPDNRGGAGGGLGAEIVARAKPDGHTLLWGANGPLVNSVLMSPQPRYDPLKDFSAIGLMSLVPMGLVVRPEVPARSLKEFLAYARAQPGGVSIGTSGLGGANHVPLEVFKAATGANILHVPYKGGGSALPDFLGGTTQGLFTEISTVLGFHREGRARILAIASEQRLSLLSDVQTFIENGLRDFTAYTFNGLWAPAGTQPDVISALNRGLLGALRDRGVLADVVARGALLANEAQATPAGARAFLEREIARTRQAMKVAGIQPQ